MTNADLFRPGENCWRTARADRLGVLVDGAAYFRAFYEAVQNARHSVLICGWDFNSHLKLLPEQEDSDWPVTLGDFLNAAAKHNENLHIHMLGWDFALLMAPGREPLPSYHFGWKTHQRVQFHLDGKQPVGSSLHQKFVVIDDRLAFLGGLDLTLGRWDTREHLPDDDRRRDQNGELSRPYHDLQMIAEGPVATALAELFRSRWTDVTGRSLEPPPHSENSPWPASAEVAMCDCDVAISRTLPRYRKQAEVREVQQLTVDMISAARHSIYMENQYLTAPVVADALAARLEEEDGPEVILVLPERTEGWLSRNTMDLLRTRVLRQLRDADKHGRLGVYFPFIPGLGNEFINVHAKLLIIDDDVLRIGSSNFNNRSMGLDIECDLAVHAGGREEVRRAIRELRERLLAEHLDRDAAAVAAAVNEQHAIVPAIDALRGDARSLRELPVDEQIELDRWLSDPEILDPERPVEPAQLITEFVPEKHQRSARSRVLLLPLLLLIVMGAFAIWQWSPLAEWTDVERLASVAERFRDSGWGVWVMLASFIVGGLVAFPVSALIVVTVLLLGPVTGFVCAYSGSILSALLCYGLGFGLGAESVRQLAGTRLNTLSQRMARQGIITIVALRIIPVAPFTVINVAAGASHISLRDFTIGTALGMLPGTIAIAVFAERLQAVIANPSPGTIATLVAAFLVLGVAVYLLQRWLSRRDELSQQPKSDASS